MKSPGWDEIPVEFYKASPAARVELFDLIRLIWKEEIVPDKMVTGVFVMLFKTRAIRMT